MVVQFKFIVVLRCIINSVHIVVAIVMFTVIKSVDDLVYHFNQSPYSSCKRLSYEAEIYHAQKSRVHKVKIRNVFVKKRAEKLKMPVYDKEDRIVSRMERHDIL